MAVLSVGQAFRNSAAAVRRNPGALAVWLALYILLGWGPSLLIWWVSGAEYIDLIRGMIQSAGKIDPAAAQAINTKIGMLSNLNLLVQLVWLSVTGAAMFRMVLRPDEKGFGFLKLGVAELCIGAVFVIFYVAFFILIFVMALVIGLLATLLIVALGVGVGATFGVVFGVAGFLVATWVYIRLWLALPMIVDDNRFRLFEAWRLSRPAQGKLVLLVLAIAGIWLLLMLFSLAINAVVLFGAVRASGLGWGGYFSRPSAALIHDLMPLILAMGAVSICATTPVQAWCAGAWAEAYRQLAPRRSVDEVFS